MLENHLIRKTLLKEETKKMERMLAKKMRKIQAKKIRINLKKVIKKEIKKIYREVNQQESLMLKRMLKGSQ